MAAARRDIPALLRQAGDEIASSAVEHVVAYDDKGHEVLNSPAMARRVRATAEIWLSAIGSTPRRTAPAFD
jgi:hypothetical protein